MAKAKRAASSKKRPAIKKTAAKSNGKAKPKTSKAKPTKAKPKAKPARAAKPKVTRRAAPPLVVAEGVLSALGLTLSRTDGPDVVRWDLDVPEEEHFELVAQMIDGEQVVVYLVFREKTAPDRMGALLEVLARVNHGLLVGAYEVDVDEGYVRLKAALDFKGTTLDEQLMTNLITGVRDVSEVYDEAIMSVMRGDTTAREAVARVES